MARIAKPIAAQMYAQFFLQPKRGTRILRERERERERERQTDRQMDRQQESDSQEESACKKRRCKQQELS